MYEMGQRWLQIEYALEDKIDALILEIQDMVKDGKEPSKAMITRLQRYQELRNQTHAEIMRYENYVEGAIKTGQYNMAVEGLNVGKETIFFFAMQGAKPENADWARRKRNVVDMLWRSSYAVGLSLQEEESSLETKLGLPTRDYAPHGGSFPIRVVGVGAIGTVTVSGLPQRDDHAMVVEALAAMAGLPLAGLALD